jgi:hypothetical protein
MFYLYKYYKERRSLRKKFINFNFILIKFNLTLVILQIYNLILKNTFLTILKIIYY